MLSHSSCSGASGSGSAGETGDQQNEHFGDVAAEEVEDELADVVEDDAAFFDGGGHRLEAIVLQHDRRGLLGDIGTADAHRHADIRLLQRRGIVDPVAEHRDNLAASTAATGR